jgi:hypothetical protein
MRILLPLCQTRSLSVGTNLQEHCSTTNLKHHPSATGYLLQRNLPLAIDQQAVVTLRTAHSEQYTYLIVPFTKTTLAVVSR